MMVCHYDELLLPVGWCDVVLTVNTVLLTTTGGGVDNGIINNVF